MNDEIGRELTPAELTPRQVVVVEPPERDFSITMWVTGVDPETVTFFSGVLNWHVTNFVKDGHLVDDQGRTVRVFEYLGEV